MNHYCESYESHICLWKGSKTPEAPHTARGNLRLPTETLPRAASRQTCLCIKGSSEREAFSEAPFEIIFLLTHRTETRVNDDNEKHTARNPACLHTFDANVLWIKEILYTIFISNEPINCNVNSLAREFIVWKIERGGNWSVGSEALTIYVKSGAVIEHDRMNQEFPYVIAAIMVPSNWCHRASPTSHRSLQFCSRCDESVCFFRYFTRGLTHIIEGGVERLKRHKLERYLRQMRGWQYGVLWRNHTFQRIWFFAW